MKSILQKGKYKKKKKKDGLRETIDWVGVSEESKMIEEIQGKQKEGESLEGFSFFFNNVENGVNEEEVFIE